MPNFKIISQPYPHGLKLKIDLEFLRPTTIIELANDLLYAGKDSVLLSKEEKKQLAEWHTQLITYLSMVHSDDFRDEINS